MHVPKVKKIRTGNKTYSHIGPKIWNSLPESIKVSHTLHSIKEKIETGVYRNQFDWFTMLSFKRANGTAQMARYKWHGRNGTAHLPDTKGDYYSYADTNNL